jgi:hypothetical protein
VRRLVADGVLPAIRYSSRARLRFNAEDVTSLLVRSTRIEGDGSRVLAGAPDGDPHHGQSSAVAGRATRGEAA